MARDDFTKTNEPKSKSLTQRIEEPDTTPPQDTPPKKHKTLKEALEENKKLKTSNSLQDRIRALNLEQE